MNKKTVSSFASGVVFLGLLASGPASAGILDSVTSAVAATGGSTGAAAPSDATISTTGTATQLAQGLVPELSRELGITTQQAEGGTGALMQLAKASLSSGEFQQISSAMPGMDVLLAAAPALGKTAGGISGLGGMMSSLGGGDSSLSGLAKVTEQFQALGISPSMIAQFAQMVVSYFRGGEGNTAALLEKGLSAALGQ